MPSILSLLLSSDFLPLYTTPRKQTQSINLSHINFSEGPMQGVAKAKMAPWYPCHYYHITPSLSLFPYILFLFSPSLEEVFLSHLNLYFTSMHFLQQHVFIHSVSRSILSQVISHQTQDFVTIHLLATSVRCGTDSVCRWTMWWPVLLSTWTSISQEVEAAVHTASTRSPHLPLPLSKGPVVERGSCVRCLSSIPLIALNRIT